MVGRILSLNTIKSKRGWMGLATLVLALIFAQLYFIALAVVRKRRHLRALEQVKKL